MLNALICSILGFGVCVASGNICKDIAEHNDSFKKSSNGNDENT